MQTNADSTADVSMADNKQIVQVNRRVLVQITGSIDSFKKTGMEAATWTPIQGKVGEVFGVNELFEHTPDQGLTAAALQNAVIHKITCLQQKNGFPCDLGVNISCCQPEETTRSGHKYAMTCLADTHTQFPLVIHEAVENQEGLQWRTKYPDYNASNLHTQGVLDVNGQQFIFCSKDHPVIDLLRMNKELLNADITEQPLIDNEWYKITKQVFGTCCSTLKNKVLSKVQTRDLNQFSVQINRIGMDSWDTSHSAGDSFMSSIPTDVLFDKDEEALETHVSKMFQKVCTYSALLEIAYDIHA